MDKAQVSKDNFSQFIHFDKYSKYIDKKQRREVWEETVTRNMEMHIKKFPALEQEIRDNYQFVLDKKVMPSMRSLQFGGEAIEKNPARLYNCSFHHIDHPDAFSETMFLLLSGSGVGYSCQKHHVEKLPPLLGPKILEGNKKPRRYLIPDSIEGWADSVKVLMESFFYGKSPVEFDFSDIRTKGTQLITSGGKAPGPEPLRACLLQIFNLLNNIIKNRGRGTSIRPLEAHDILCYIADSVLSGGIRRCLPIETNVFTTRGLVKIQEIVVGDEVYTTSGTNKVNNVFVQGKQFVSEIQLDGMKFRATKNHKMAVLDDKGNKIWKTVEELNVEDKLLHFDGIMGGEETSLPVDFTQNRPDHSTTCAPITIPELDTEIAWLIGFFHGNGYVYNRKTSKSGKGGSSKISITTDSRNEGFIERAAEVLSRFSVPPIIKSRKGENTKEVSVYSQRLVEYFEKIKTPNNTIRVPEFITKAKPEIRGAYLAGVIDSDGSIKNRPIQACSTVYPEFAEDLRVLYATLGIPTKIKERERKEENWKTLYQINLIGFRERYNDLIGEFSSKGLLPITKPPMGYSVPNSVVKTNLRNKDYKKLWTGQGDMNYERFISFDKTKDILDGIPLDILSITHDIEEVETFDIEIDEAHEFYANGILTHNSAMISLFSFDDEEMIKCKSNFKVLDWSHVYSEGPVNNFGEPQKIIQMHVDSTGNKFYDLNVTYQDSTGTTKEKTIYWVGESDFQTLNGIKMDSEYIKGDQWKYNILSKKKDTLPWFYFEGQRGRANNSITLVRDKIQKDQFISLMKNVEDSMAGEPGFFFTNDSEWGLNPCGEIGLRSNQYCNLCTINASMVTSQEDFNLASKAAAFIGTLQASYTNFHYLRSKWQDVTEKEALLGVSITGIADKEFLKLNEKEASLIAVEENERVAKLIGINKAARVTTCKPEGTSSSLLNTSSGIHAWHDKYYLRRARVNKANPVYTFMSLYYSELIEDDFYNPTSSAVIMFPLKAPEGAIYRYESAIELLERAKRYQLNWVKPGHRSGKNRNNVSLTVSVRPNEWEEVTNYIWNEKENSTGISLLPYDGGSYIQAPFESLTKEEYEALLEKVEPLDFSLLIEDTNNTQLSDNLACVGLNCTL